MLVENLKDTSGLANSKEINFLALRIKFFGHLLNRGFKRRKLVVIFIKIKYSDRNDLLLSKNSLVVDLQKKNPESALETLMDMITDHHFQEKMSMAHSVPPIVTMN